MSVFNAKADSSLTSESPSDVILSELADLARMHHITRLKRVMSPMNDPFDKTGNHSLSKIEHHSTYSPLNPDFVPAKKAKLAPSAGSRERLHVAYAETSSSSTGGHASTTPAATPTSTAPTDVAAITITPANSDGCTSPYGLTPSSNELVVEIPSDASSNASLSPSSITPVSLPSPGPTLHSPVGLSAIPGSKIGVTDVDRMVLLVQAREGVRPKPKSKVSKPEGYVYSCTVKDCGKSFRQQAHLRTHMRIHNGERPHVCPFENCNKAFSQLCNLRTHFRSHTGERPYKCPICEKSFTQQGNMRHHQLTHYNENPLVCKLENCNKTFNQLGNLKAHQNSAHRDLIIAFSERLAKGKSVESMPEQEREMFDYFCDLYKNCNRGIKGRGKGTKTILSKDNRIRDYNGQVSNSSNVFQSDYQTSRKNEPLYSPPRQINSLPHNDISQQPSFDLKQPQHHQYSQQPQFSQYSTSSQYSQAMQYSQNQLKLFSHSIPFPQMPQQLPQQLQSASQLHSVPQLQTSGISNDAYAEKLHKPTSQNLVQSHSPYIPVPMQLPYGSLPPGMPYYYVTQ